MEIKSIYLLTNQLKKTKIFYINQLGFTLLQEQADSFTFQVGSGELTSSSKDVVGAPYYHFAFNIPSNQFKEAKAWTKECVELLMEDGADEVHFTQIEAHSLYFSDPFGNIVEFISRYAISEKRAEAFSPESIINIVEIGLIVENAVTGAEKLAEVEVFERDKETISNQYLNFMGIRNKGIFIILSTPGRKWLFSEKNSAVFPLIIGLQNNSQINVLQNSQIEIVKN